MCKETLHGTATHYMGTKSDTIILQIIYNVKNESVVYYQPVAGRIAVDFRGSTGRTRAHESIRGDR
jgi:hypothetical protein